MIFGVWKSVAAVIAPIALDPLWKGTKMQMWLGPIEIHNVGCK